MKFGTVLKQERESRNIEQRALAALAGLSPTMIWRIETGKDIPTKDTANKLIAALDALGLDALTHNTLLATLDRERKAMKKSRQSDKGRAKRRESKKQGEAFPAAMQLLLNGLEKSVADLVNWFKPKRDKKQKRPSTTIYSWANGTLFPSAETLRDELIPAFRSTGASDSDIEKLKIAHAIDVFSRSLSTLVYLDEADREHINNCLANCLSDKAKKDGQKSLFDNP